MRKLISISFATMMFTSKIFAGQSYFSYTGGGAEDRKKSGTIFDLPLGYASNYVNNPKTKLAGFEIAFDGGHEKSKAILKEKFPKTENKGFNNSTLNKMIQDYIEKIDSGKIKPGDQILLTFDTHGAKAGKDVTSHKIATDPQVYDANNTSAYDLFSMDNLKKLMELTKKNNVKLGIIDLGCYSGSSLNLDDSHACIISSTTDDLFSYKGDDTFTAEFFKNMAPGKNLEEVFVKARRNSDGDRSMPMISTNIGKSLYNDIYTKLSPYIHFQKENVKIAGHDNLIEYLSSIDSDQKFCKREQDFKSLINNIKNAEELSKNTFSILNYEFTLGSESFGVLKDLLGKYKKKMDEISKDYYSQKRKLLEKENVYFVNDKGVKMVAPYTLEALLSSDYYSYLLLERRKANPDKTLLSLFQSLSDKQEEIKKKRPELLKVNENIKNIVSKVKGTTDLSIAIAREERKLYDTLYKKKSLTNSSSNPCRDFVL